MDFRFLVDSRGPQQCWAHYLVEEEVSTGPRSGHLGWQCGAPWFSGLGTPAVLSFCPPLQGHHCFVISDASPALW